MLPGDITTNLATTLFLFGTFYSLTLFLLFTIQLIVFKKRMKEKDEQFLAVSAELNIASSAANEVLADSEQLTDALSAELKRTNLELFEHATYHVEALKEFLDHLLFLTNNVDQYEIATTINYHDWTDRLLFTYGMVNDQMKKSSSLLYAINAVGLPLSDAIEHLVTKIKGDASSCVTLDKETIIYRLDNLFALTRIIAVASTEGANISLIGGVFSIYNLQSSTQMRIKAICSAFQLDVVSIPGVIALQVKKEFANSAK